MSKKKPQPRVFKSGIPREKVLETRRAESSILNMFYVRRRKDMSGNKKLTVEVDVSVFHELTGLRVDIVNGSRYHGATKEWKQVIVLDGELLEII